MTTVGTTFDTECVGVVKEFSSTARYSGITSVELSLSMIPEIVTELAVGFDGADEYTVTIHFLLSNFLQSCQSYEL